MQSNHASGELWVKGFVLGVGCGSQAILGFELATFLPQTNFLIKPYQAEM